MLDEDSVFEDISPIISGMGLTLVDCRLQQSKFGHACHIVLFREGGVGTQECAQVYRTIMPRLEILLSSQDIHLEVGSPGTDRKIRLAREYPIFLGRGVTIIERNGTTVGGVLASSDEEYLTLNTKEGTLKVPLADIVKAKLDYTQEVR